MVPVLVVVLDVVAEVVAGLVVTVVVVGLCGIVEVFVGLVVPAWWLYQMSLQ